MNRKLIRNDIRHHKFLSVVTVFFMSISAMLIVLSIVLSVGLLSSIDHLMAQAQVPDFMQMYAGDIDKEELSQFAKSHTEVKDWQICRFLNIENSQITFGDTSLLGNTQDNGISVQGGRI